MVAEPALAWVVVGSNDLSETAGGLVGCRWRVPWRDTAFVPLHACLGRAIIEHAIDMLKQCIADPKKDAQSLKIVPKLAMRQTVGKVESDPS